MTHAVRQVKLGKTYIDPEHISDIVVDRQLFHEALDPINALSKREFQLFKLMAEGNSILEIAENLSISSKTVGVHHASIMRKLKLKNAAQLVRLAILCDIISL